MTHQGGEGVDNHEIVKTIMIWRRRRYIAYHNGGDHGADNHDLRKEEVTHHGGDSVDNHDLK